MSPENRRELIGRFESKTEKRRYYLLAAAGASIGFLVTQMNDLVPNFGLWLMVLSLVCLGASALLGLVAVNLSIAVTQGEVVLYDFEPKALPEAVSVSWVKDYLKDTKLDPTFKKMRMYDKWQTIFLLVGCLLVPVWSLTRCEECTTYLWRSLTNLG
ncbi:MAG: hypothetical protein IKG52_03150 [Rhodobacteraceae bacterium]|nr:hypothetical protein [Paracoccaceae bacterium]